MSSRYGTRLKKYGEGVGDDARVALCVLVFLSAVVVGPLFGQTEMKRDRGESFYTCQSSNTEGAGNVWLTVGGVGHVWDDVPIRLDNAGAPAKGFWVSNARAFPEVALQAGLTGFCMATLQSRLITWAAVVPGWVSGDVKFTLPNNKSLRLFGIGLDLKYLYNNTDGPPTLGGYVGFMPEGYVTKGSVFEGRVIFDADVIAKITTVPLRAIVNVGLRQPLSEYRDNYQYLLDAGAVYSGYDYDFFATYSLEAFDNFFGPKIFTQTTGGDTKRFAVWFQEDPMYLTLGGNVHYKNGVKLSVAVPLLLSVNEGSKMDVADLTALNENSPENYSRFPYEISHGIKDPFDPWFVKWKIVVSLSFPIRYTMTSAEMMRNFLLLKNTRQQNRLDIDNRLRNFEVPATTPEPMDSTIDADKRLQEIQKRKEEMRNQE
jgi:hypothetical protein